MASIDLAGDECYIWTTEQTPNQCYVCNWSLGTEVGKVKKAGAVRKPGAKSAKTAKPAPSGARKSPSKRKALKAVSKKGIAERRGSKTKSAVDKAPAPPVFRVQELDPQSKCGPGTSVQRLYRLREAWANGAVHSHLVFFDRHGWYCEHGRSCPAVPHAMKFGDRERQHGPTNNGRMRA